MCSHEHTDGQLWLRAHWFLKYTFHLGTRIGENRQLVTDDRTRVRETFELNQLKSAPSQHLLVFPGLTGCKLVAVNLDRPISYTFFQVPANFFFIVMTTGQEFGH
jgi:hypothetical protein